MIRLIHLLTLIFIFLPIVFYFISATSHYPDAIFLGVGILSAIFATLITVNLWKSKLLGKNVLYLLAGVAIVLIPVIYLSFQEVEDCIMFTCYPLSLTIFTVPYILIFLTTNLVTAFYLRRNNIVRILNWKQLLIPLLLAPTSLVIGFAYFISILR